MKRSILVFIITMALPLAALGQTESPTKRELNVLTRELIDVLGFSSNSISINKDSVRIWFNRDYYDLFFHDKRLWGFKQYSKDGLKIDSSNFKDGNGFIYREISGSVYYLEIKNGLLNGKVERYVQYNKDEYKIFSTCHYQNGLKDGICSYRSDYDQSFVSKKAYYNKGELTRVQSFGITKFRLALNIALFKPIIVEKDKLCQESIYEDGKLISSTCFVKKCNRCGY